jgi:hypothetical protein
MKTTRILAATAGLLTLAALSAHALSIAIFPAPVRFARADAAFVGKVTAVDDKAVKADAFKGDTREMKIATVKVSETIHGKTAREIKVGFFINPMPKVGGGPVIIGGGYVGPQLMKDQEGILILQKHPTMKDVYTINEYPGIIAKGTPDYDADLKELKVLARLLADPMKGLKSKDAGERVKAAALLATRYKASPGVGAKTEAVPAAESKLILEALAEGDWEPRVGRFDKITPQMAFFSLGLKAGDGWDPARFTPDAAKKWLKENAGKYKMERFVREAAGPSEEPR